MIEIWLAFTLCKSSKNNALERGRTEEELSDIELSRCGLNGSPTRVKSTYTPVREKKGMLLQGMDADKAAKKLVDAVLAAKIM